MGMRILTYEEMLEAQMMGELFEDSIEMSSLSSPLFIRYFMNSSLSELYRSLSHQYTSLSNREIVEMVEEGKRLKKKEIVFTKDEMHWIGYCYLAMMRLTDRPGEEIYRLFPSMKMREHYPIYHTFSIEAAVNRMFEEISLEPGNLQERTMRILSENLKKQKLL